MRLQLLSVLATLAAGSVYADDAQNLGRYQTGSETTDVTGGHYHGGGYRGGYYGGSGYRPYYGGTSFSFSFGNGGYYGGYRGGYGGGYYGGGYYGGYRPYYAPSFYYAPRPIYVVPSYYYAPGYYGISNTAPATTPTATLSISGNRAPIASPTLPSPYAAPQPLPQVQPTPEAPSLDVKISNTAAKTPQLKYPAYGDR